MGVIPADVVPAPSSAAYAPNQAPFEPIYSKDITCRIPIDLGGEPRILRGERPDRRETAEVVAEKLVDLLFDRNCVYSV